MRRWSELLLLICALLTVHTAFGADKPLDRRAVVHSADTNADGRIDRGEFHQGATEAFFLLDANKDGFLTTDEGLTGVPGADLPASQGGGSQSGREDGHPRISQRPVEGL